MKISASNLYRYFFCPAAMNHEQEFVKREQTKYAEEGTKKHEEMESALSSKEPLEKNAQAKLLMDQLKQFGMMISTICEDDLKYQFDNFTLVGKPDLIALMHNESNKLGFVVVDYKFGYNLVPAKNNLQLNAYALLVLKNIKITPSWIKLAIFQNDILDVIDVSREEILSFENSINSIVGLAKNFIYNPHETACKWCQYRTECVTLKQTVLQTTEMIVNKINQQQTKEEKFEYQKSLIMNKKLIEYALEDAEDFFKKQLQGGSFYDFVELKNNGSMKSWTKEVNESSIIEELLALNPGKCAQDIADLKLKSISQLKGIIEIPDSFIESREKAKSLKIKEVKKEVTITDSLF